MEPRIPLSNYITAEGYQVLADELEYLWKVKRPEVTQAVSEAAAQGDRSENAEYIYGKKQLRQIDGRLRFLSKKLEYLSVYDKIPKDQSRAGFGAWIKIEDEEGAQRCFRLVGADESDPDQGKLSINSPVACALLNKQVDDETQVELPDGAVTYYLLEISYTQNICNKT